MGVVWGLAGAMMLLPVFAEAAPLASKASVQRLLEGYEVDLSSARLATAGSGWEHALCELVDAPETSGQIRLRALTALAFVKTPETASTLQSTLERYVGFTKGIEVLYAVESIRSLAAVRGPTAAPLFRPLMDHPTSMVRREAAVALWKLKDPEIRERARQRLQVETDPVTTQSLAEILLSRVE